MTSLIKVLGAVFRSGILIVSIAFLTICGYAISVIGKTHTAFIFTSRAAARFYRVFVVVVGGREEYPVNLFF